MDDESFRFAAGYELPSYPFVMPPDLHATQPRTYPIVIVGAGLSGLTLACDLALRGIEAVVLDEDDTIGVRGASSRGICYAQKSLEIFARLGIYQRIRDKGVIWSVGKTRSGDDPVYTFDLRGDNPSEQPPFINLQQFYLEWFLVDRIQELGRCDLRWKNRLTAIEPAGDHVLVSVDTPAGPYRLRAGYLVDATGANSPIRDALGLDAHVSRSGDRWCITDVRFKKPLPIERWTWVDAPFNEGRAVWQHLMADQVWRLDYQMAPDCDPAIVSHPDVAGQRIRSQLGADTDFEFVWIGPYMYRDHLLDTFRQGRILFIGDSAHVVSPFGARGGNSGIQDAANLGWKLALVLAGQATDQLLDSYDAERQPAAQENLAVTSRTARFLAPRSAAEHTLRRAVVALARRYEFARTMVNTGRMSIANPYPPSPFLPQGGFSVQNVAISLPDRQPARLVDLLGASTRLVGIWFDARAAESAGVLEAGVLELQKRWPLDVYRCGGDARLPAIGDPEGALAGQLQASPGMFCLLRPDGYCAARIEHADCAAIGAALKAALGHD